jgi:ATP-dependent Clp protease ATP-binding subunit ClpA
MFEGLSDRGRAVVALARREAARRQNPLLVPAHVLVGILEEGSPDGAGILAEMGVSARQVRVLASALFAPGRSKPGSVAGISDAVENLLKRAVGSTFHTQHENVEPGHLLLALAEQDILPRLFHKGSLLEACSIDGMRVRSEVYRHFHEGQTPEQRSVERAVAAFLAHPHARGMKELAGKVGRAHARALAHEDLETAAILRGNLVWLANEHEESFDDWTLAAEGLLGLPLVTGDEDYPED